VESGPCGRKQAASERFRFPVPPGPSQQLSAAPGPRKTRGSEGSRESGEAAPGALCEGSGTVHWVSLVSGSDGSDKFEWKSDGNGEEAASFNAAGDGSSAPVCSLKIISQISQSDNSVFLS
jgi:hypothetical protein